MQTIYQPTNTHLLTPASPTDCRQASLHSALGWALRNKGWLEGSSRTTGPRHRLAHPPWLCPRTEGNASIWDIRRQVQV